MRELEAETVRRDEKERAIRAKLEALVSKASTQTPGAGKLPLRRFFDPASVIDELARIELEGWPSDAQKREQADYKRLLSSPSCRPLAPLPDDYARRLDELLAEQPNMSEFIEFVVKPELALSDFRGAGGYVVQPVLLVGPPGCGKSLITSTLSRRLGVPALELKGETMQSSATLCGAAKFWSNAQPGILFDFACKTRFSNWLVAVDEIDKMRGAADYPPQNAFYPLLERGTAERFRDNACPEAELDLSRLSWIFTANSVDEIPAPLRSRLTVIPIAALTPSQARGVAHRIFESLRQEVLGHDNPIQLSSAALDVLQHESPRRQRMLLRTALGRALLDRAATITGAHLAAPRLEDVARKIGFV